MSGFIYIPTEAFHILREECLPVLQRHPLLVSTCDHLTCLNWWRAGIFVTLILHPQFQTQCLECGRHLKTYWIIKIILPSGPKLYICKVSRQFELLAWTSGDPLLRVNNPAVLRTSCVLAGGGGKCCTKRDYFTSWLSVSSLIKKGEGGWVKSGVGKLRLMGANPAYVSHLQFRMIFTFLNGSKKKNNMHQKPYMTP